MLRSSGRPANYAGDYIARRKTEAPRLASIPVGQSVEQSGSVQGGECVRAPGTRVFVFFVVTANARHGVEPRRGTAQRELDSENRPGL